MSERSEHIEHGERSEHTVHGERSEHIEHGARAPGDAGLPDWAHGC